MDNDNQRELTFGERAVGLTFNPSNIASVQLVKEQMAGIVDTLNDLRTQSGDPEIKRMLAIAITEVQTAQMWAVKAVTWGQK